MNTFNEASLNDVLRTSEFLALLKPLKNNSGVSRLFGTAVRALTQKEIADLTAQGNQCTDWNAVTVSIGFSTQHISGNIITGPCVFGSFCDARNNTERDILPVGVRNSILSHTEIGDNCRVYGSTISNYLLCSGAVIHNVGALICSRDAVFGNGTVISVGIESGGREVRFFAELSFELATTVALQRRNTAFLSAYNTCIDTYVSTCRSTVGIVGSNSVCMNTPSIIDTCIIGTAIIRGATLVKNSTIIGTSAAPTVVGSGAVVENSCLREGCKVLSHAVVSGSMLTGHVGAERHANVVNSIIAHDTGIAEGEVTASLVGPFVGFHHQALLIGALWPKGKGNIGYGANVGSNHTSKAPDQEIFCGEGLFFGLGVNIKFPANFSEAPYSIIATGLTTLPQRVRFPFSLLCAPVADNKDIPPAYNELIPGWVLSDNMYTVKRNEEKFKKRSSVSAQPADADVFSQDTVDCMRAARDALSGICTVKPVYTDKDIDGIGKNFCTEENRQKAITTYTAAIEHYCLKGMKKRIEQLTKEQTAVAAEAVYAADGPYKHQLEIMHAEGYCTRTVEENLNRYVELEEYYADATCRAREKDDVRGKKIFCDYDVTHACAANDPLVKAVKSAARVVQSDVALLIKKIAG
jgi:hypothetical protein